MNDANPRAVRQLVHEKGKYTCVNCWLGGGKLVSIRCKSWYSWNFCHLIQVWTLIRQNHSTLTDCGGKYTFLVWWFNFLWFIWTLVAPSPRTRWRGACCWPITRRWSQVAGKVKDVPFTLLSTKQRGKTVYKETLDLSLGAFYVSYYTVRTSFKCHQSARNMCSVCGFKLSFVGLWWCGVRWWHQGVGQDHHLVKPRYKEQVLPK